MVRRGGAAKIKLELPFDPADKQGLGYLRSASQRYSREVPRRKVGLWVSGAGGGGISV